MEVKRSEDIREDPWAAFREMAFLEKELEAFEQVLRELEPGTSESFLLTHM